MNNDGFANLYPTSNKIAARTDNGIRFNNLGLTTQIKKIALGGINENNIKKLKCTKVTGFASISWIKKNRPNKIRPV